MKIYFVSLGCDKNLVDSEKMLTLLSQNGYEITDQPEDAEVIVVNTCCFIHDAKMESIETLLELAEWKKNGKCKSLIAAGCLAQRYHDEIREEIPEVDGIVGTTAFDQIVTAVEKSLSDGKSEMLSNLDALPLGITKRVNSSGGFTSYLKIAEGCNKCCSYCIIPKLRGHYRSVPMEELIQEAKNLTAQGVKELILVAQETTMYGIDLYGEKRLPELLTKLCELHGLEWIRILYCYPEEITEELADVIAKEPKICHYLDMPIQHCNDEILKRMGRRTNKTELIQTIDMLRSKVPDIALRTTLITGFPGETKKQHEELVSFVQKMKFDRLGVFTYSEEEGTAAAKMPNQVDEEEKVARQDELMNTQQNVVFEKNENMTGVKLDVIVDGYIPDEQVYVGRSYMDAPGVDGCIFFEAPYEIISGTILKVEITDARGYDLIGCICEEEEDE